jgi:hypothetical protein
MMLPETMPEKGILAPVWRRLNRLRAYVVSLRPVAGRGIAINHTSNGVVISAKDRGGGGGADDTTARWA